MATTNSNHHSPKYLYPKPLATNQRLSNSTNNDDFDNFEMLKFDVWNTSSNDENTISKARVISRKLPLKPHPTVPSSGKSLPINVPNWSKIMRDHVDYDDGGDDEDDWLPPHEYLSRIRSASLSVHEGVGRTLKGRDLSRLRSAIWKQTGFEQD